MKGVKVLILSRKKHEKIVVGDGDARITIMVTDIRGDKVRIGVMAPPNVPIHREEVYDAIKRQGESLAPEGP